MELSVSHKLIVTIEENVISGGAGSGVLEVVSQHNLKCNTLCLGLPDRFTGHGSQEEILADCGLDNRTILAKIEKAMN